MEFFGVEVGFDWVYEGDSEGTKYIGVEVGFEELFEGVPGEMEFFVLEVVLLGVYSEVLVEVEVTDFDPDSFVLVDEVANVSDDIGMCSGSDAIPCEEPEDSDSWKKN